MRLVKLLDFLGVEEVGVPPNLPPIAPVEAPPQGEEFAGAEAAALEEFSYAPPLPPPIVVQLENVEEVIVSVVSDMPDEHGQPLWLWPLPPGVAVSLEEQFQGSLPLDETPALVWVPELPRWITWQSDEEFGGAHPTEEISPPLLLPPLNVLNLAPPNEDFAGSLPLEEPPAPFFTTTPPVWITASIEEEFGGAHPTEEISSVIFFFDAPLLLPLQPREEEFGLPHPIEEPGLAPLIPPPIWLSLDSREEDFSGAVVVEEWPQELFVPLAPNLLIASSSEEFSGAVVIEETSPLQFLFYVPPVSLFVDAEVLPVPPIPPTPPTPLFPALVKPYGSDLPASAGLRVFEGLEVRLPLDRLNVDYALLAFSEEAMVRALADGVVELFVDEQSRTFVKLTADDGTTYIYAGVRVKSSKPRRVVKGELIGTARATSAKTPRIGGAPKQLPGGASANDESIEASPATGAGSVFGVMPVVRQQPALPLFNPPATLVFAPPAPAPSGLALPAPSGPLTVSEKIVIGIGIVAIVWGIYTWIAARALPDKIRRSRPKKRKRTQAPRPKKRAPKRRPPKRQAPTERSNTLSREKRRMRAVKMVLGGASLGEVAEHFEVSHEAVRKWVAWHENGGAEALEALPRQGPDRRVPLSTLEKKLRKILNSDPEDHGFTGDHWSLGRIQKVLAKTNIQYSRTQISRILRALKDRD